MTFGQKSKINSKLLTVNNHLILGKTATEINSLFGNPARVENVYLEMEDKTGVKYKYDGFQIIFVDNSVSSFEISNAKFSFTSNNIKVGSSIDNLSSIFQESFDNRVNSGIQVELEDIDLFVVISYGADNVIKKIALHEN